MVKALLCDRFAASRKMETLLVAELESKRSYSRGWKGREPKRRNKAPLSYRSRELVG